MLYFLKQKYKITAYSGEENHFDAIESCLILSVFSCFFCQLEGETLVFRARQYDYCHNKIKNKILAVFDSDLGCCAKLFFCLKALLSLWFRVYDSFIIPEECGSMIGSTQSNLVLFSASALSDTEGSDHMSSHRTCTSTASEVK